MKKYKLSSLLLTLTLIISSIFTNLPVSYAQSESDNLRVSLQGEQKEDVRTSFNEYELLKQINKEYVESKKNQSVNLNTKLDSLSAKETYTIENYTEVYSNKIYELKELEI